MALDARRMKDKKDTMGLGCSLMFFGLLFPPLLLVGLYFIGLSLVINPNVPSGR